MYPERYPVLRAGVRLALSSSLFIGSSGWARTNDPRINSPLLCQLSYAGIFLFVAGEALALEERKSRSFTILEARGPPGVEADISSSCCIVKG